MNLEETEEETPLAFEAVVFELENVIFDSTPYEAKAWEKTAASYGVSRNDWPKLWKQYGDWGIAAGMADNSQAEKEDMIQKKEDHYHHETKGLSNQDVMPGVGPLIKDLKKNGVPIACASRREHARDRIEILGLGDFFNEVIDGADVENKTPLSDVFFAAADDLSIPPSTCVAIVDVCHKQFQKAQEPTLFIIGVGSKDPVDGTDWVVSSTGELTYEALKKEFQQPR